MAEKSKSSSAKSGSAKSGSAKSSSAKSNSAKSSSAKSGSTSKTTTNHDEIRRWVEKHGGRPATIADTQHGREEAGLLRIDFPGGAGDPPLEPITWEQFFDKFDESDLAFLYQEEKADGSDSTFCKFVNRS